MCQNDSQAMKKMEGDYWDYEAVDVTDFLADQLKEGDFVEALDSNNQQWRQGCILRQTRGARP